MERASDEENNNVAAAPVAVGLYQRSTQYDRSNDRDTSANNEANDEAGDNNRQKSEGGGEATIRVSNISKSVNDFQLKDLFSKFGNVVKLILPKVVLASGAKENKGFAYVSYSDKASAEKAMLALDGKGFDYMILAIEWAKHSNSNFSSSSGGLSSGFVSGYGKQLAQDTKEKAIFTSHGNH